MEFLHPGWRLHWPAAKMTALASHSKMWATEAEVPLSSPNGVAGSTLGSRVYRHPLLATARGWGKIELPSLQVSSRMMTRLPAEGADKCTTLMSFLITMLSVGDQRRPKHVDLREHAPSRMPAQRILLLAHQVPRHVEEAMHVLDNM